LNKPPYTYAVTGLNDRPMNPIEEKHDELIPSEPIGEHLAEKHATITKETAVGFAEWCGTSRYVYDVLHKCWYKMREISEYQHGYEFTDEKYTTSELYDLYVESLKQSL